MARVLRPRLVGTGAQEDVGRGIDQGRGPGGEPVDLSAPPPQAAQSLEERRHHVRVELRAGEPAQLSQALPVAERAPVRPFAGHRVVAVHHAEHARDLGDVHAGEAVRVPAAVEVLVVVPHAGHELVAEERPRDLGADAGVLADELPLLRGQRPGLEQHAVRDADLADVVQEGDVLQLAQALVVPPELAPEQRRIPGHAAGVAERVVVLGAERRAQGAQVGEVQPLDLLVEVRALDGEGDQLGDRLGDGDLVLREPALHVVQQLDRADHLAAGDERKDDEAALAVGERRSRSLSVRRGSWTVSKATARRSSIASAGGVPVLQENSRPAQTPSKRPFVLEATQMSRSSPSSR